MKNVPMEIRKDKTKKERFVCPECGCDGTDRPHHFAELVWNYWPVEIVEGSIKVDMRNIDFDATQEGEGYGIECGRCNEIFQVPQREIDFG